MSTTFGIMVLPNEFPLIPLDNSAQQGIETVGDLKMEINDQLIPKIKLKKGDMITYCPSHGSKEKGIVKSINGKIAFDIVYNQFIQQSKIK